MLSRKHRGIGLAWIALALAACGSPATGGLGASCDTPEQCSTEAPLCVAIAAPDYAPGVCAIGCPAAGCPSGSECREGSCILCHAEVAASVGPGGACGCDADCAGGGICTNLGTCQTDCTAAPCPAGFSCDGTPPACRECLGGGPRAAGEMCSCNADCNAGLSCVGGLCGVACRLDEMCGADECQHTFLAGSTCGPIDPTCAFSAAGAVGATCVCNADCGPVATLCLTVVSAGAVTNVCSTTCSPEQACPSGSRCCQVTGQEPYCVDQALASALGATCL